MDHNYNEYVKQVTPTTSLPLNMLKAFFTGGAICLLGEILVGIFKHFDVGDETAAMYEILILIGLAVLLTGLGLYYKLTKFGGAGSIVPITGFANSVASAAIEYKKEGQVFGIGCKIFTIAGPVILYGLLSSWVLGIIYMIF